ncbi:MAG: extracellular solute-binding protein [Chloroflexi bacterium]|nr:extracellular solute-binding protein [Chloroflexota bacterium]
MQKLIIFMIIFALTMVLGQACVPQSPAQTPPVAAVTAAPAAKAAWETEWEATLATAKKEGQVNIYSGYGPEWRDAFAEVMARRYSIVLDSFSAKTDEVIERVMTEQRYKTYNADLLPVISLNTFLGSVKPADILQPLDRALILPEVTDPKAWWRGRLTWFDPDRKTVLVIREFVSPPMVVNTDMVKPGQLETWEDLLNPNWKGKIVLSDPTTTGGGRSLMIMLAYGMRDWDYIRALVKQEPILSRDNRQMVEWVAKAKYPVAIGASKETVTQFQMAGSPIKYVSPPGVGYLSIGSGTITQPKNAPHPNAAKVFINFFLSKEGQTLSSKLTGYQSARADVPTDFLDPATVRQPGVKYVSELDEGYPEKLPELTKGVQDIFRAYASK